MVNDRGTMITDWDAGPAQSTTVAGCRVQPGVSSEDLAARTSNIIRWTVFAPGEADVRATDAVILDGVRYSVDATPIRRINPTGRIDYLRIHLIDWVG
jgi:hypothetical protein